MDAIFVLFIISAACQTAVTVDVPTIKLNDGRDIPGFALGTALGNNSKGRVEPAGEEVELAVTWALAAGYRHIDTAYAYRVEDQVGKGVARGMRDQGLTRGDVFITTKLWNTFHARDAVVPALRKSLNNLNMDYVDLYLIHWPVSQFENLTFDTTDYIETWRGMIEAKQLGLAKSIGVSNFNEEQMDRIAQYGLETPAVLQVEINLNLQQPSLLAYCRAHNITVMGYTPFGSLFPSRAAPAAPPPRHDAPELLALADRHNKTVTQIVLRYLVELGVIPIPKSLTKSRIEENINIFDFSLTEEDKTLLRSYDKNYRVIPQYKWMDHPYYPFAKTEVGIALVQAQKVAADLTNDILSRSRFPGYYSNFGVGFRKIKNIHFAQNMQIM